MNTLLLEHLAAVSKIAAYRQAREHQEGVDASEGYLSVASDMGMTGDNLSVVSAFRAPEPNGKAQYVTTLIRDNHRYSLWMETQGHFYCGTGGGSQSLHLGDLAAGTDHLVALCRDGGTLYCYLDGELKGTLGVYDFVAADGFYVGRAAVNQDTLFTSTIYGAKVFNYVLSAAEVSALYNNGDPAGYVLPAEMKSGERRCIAEYLPQNLVVAHKHDFPQVVFPNGRYTPSKSVYAPNNSASTTVLWDQPQANGFSGSFMRFEAITAVSIYNDYWSSYLKGAVPVVVTIEYRSTKPLYHRTSIASKYIFIADANEGDAKIITIMAPDCTGSSRISFADAPVTTDDWLELRVLSIEVAEGAVLSWLDSAKQLPLNDEYLPPLLEPIVIGDATPIRITGDNSYTWIGSESPLNVWMQVAKSFAIGVTYKVNITVSNYEAGAPFVWLGSSVNVPAANGTYDILVPASVSQSYLPIYGGPSGSDRRLTLTVNKIEPVVERGYDLIANGTPEIIYK